MVWVNPPKSVKGLAGFVYCIENKLTGQRYIGKKFFWSIRHRRIKGRKNRKRVVKEDKWQTYTGSSKELNEDIKKHGIENFHFEILSIHKTRGKVNYEEVRLQFELDVLRAKNEEGEYIYYNQNIANKFFRGSNI